MNDIKLVDEEIRELFESLGFKRHMINREPAYELGGAYYRLDYINNDMGYAIESAENIEEAKKNIFEDSDVVSIMSTKEETIKAIKECLTNYYL